MNGRVTLLGAGPGDPELLTLIGRRRLSEADVVLYDRLIDPSLLAFTNDQAKLIDVGKLPQHHKVKQSEINRMLVDYAQQGQKVVRLKAGDPYVFGRGGEEAQVLEKAGVNFEVIPGITSAIAGLAAVGIPITHRDFASSFHIITGHHKQDGQKQLDWENIAHQEGTLVFLMGMAQLPTICQQLVAHGKDPQTPVAIIQWATQWRQRMAIGDLTTINQIVEEQHLSSPALIVVGDVVKLSAQLNVQWPLQGVHVLVPFSKQQRLFNQLTDRGATVDFYRRAVKTPLAADLTVLDDAAALLVDSIAAYRQFVQLLVAADKDLRCLADKKILAANRVVARHLRAAGLIVDGVLPNVKLPDNFVEIGSGQAVVAGGTFLDLYQKQPQKISLPFDLAEFSAVVFPSTDSLHDFLNALSATQRGELAGLKAFVMGPTIKQAAQEAGFQKVIDCRPKVAATVQRIEEEFTVD